MKLSSTVRTVLVALLALAWAGLGWAEIRTYALELDEVSGLESGRLALVEGVAGPEGQGFLLEGLTFLQPVAVGLLADDPDQELELTLAKHHWDNALRSGSTGTEGSASYRLRTQGELRILVAGQEPAAFKLLVWAGGEAEPPMEPAVVSIESHEARRAGASDGSNGLTAFQWGVLSLLAGILAALGLLIFKRGRS